MPVLPKRSAGSNPELRATPKLDSETGAGAEEDASPQKINPVQHQLKQPSLSSVYQEDLLAEHTLAQKASA